MEATCETCRFAMPELIRAEQLDGKVFFLNGKQTCRHPESPLHTDYIAREDHCGEHQPRETEPILTPPTNHPPHHPRQHHPQETQRHEGGE